MSNKAGLDAQIEKAIDLLYRSQNEKKIKKAVEMLRELTEEGNADAWYFLARCYYGGDYGFLYSGIEKNTRLGDCYLLESIERGSAFGVLEALHLESITAEQIKERMPFESFAQARDIVLEYAQNGEGFSQFMIGNTFYWGDNYTIDEIDYMMSKEKQYRLNSTIWYEKAMKSGIHLGFKNYVNLYLGGESGIERNLDVCDEILKKTADGEWLEAKFCYGRFLEENERYKEAEKYYRQAAMRGYHLAWSYLADIIIKQKEMNNSKIDMEVILRCYKTGEKESDDRCAYKMAMVYYYGERGVKQNYKKSYELFTKIAERGYEDAYPFVGMHYFYGRGIKQDYEEAKKWFEKNEEYITSCVHIGIMYEKGIIFERNIDMAVQYIEPCTESNEYARRFMSKVNFINGHWEIDEY